MQRNVFHGASDRPPWVRCGAPDVIIAGKMPMTGVLGQPLVQFFQGGGSRGTGLHLTVGGDGRPRLRIGADGRVCPDGPNGRPAGDGPGSDRSAEATKPGCRTGR